MHAFRRCAGGDGPCGSARRSPWAAGSGSPARRGWPDWWRPTSQRCGPALRLRRCGRRGAGPGHGAGGPRRQRGGVVPRRRRGDGGRTGRPSPARRRTGRGRVGAVVHDVDRPSRTALGEPGVVRKRRVQRRAHRAARRRPGRRRRRPPSAPPPRIGCTRTCGSSGPGRRAAPSRRRSRPGRGAAGCRDRDRRWRRCAIPADADRIAADLPDGGAVVKHLAVDHDGAVVTSWSQRLSAGCPDAEPGGRLQAGDLVTRRVEGVEVLGDAGQRLGRGRRPGVRSPAIAAAATRWASCSTSPTWRVNATRTVTPVGPRSMSATSSWRSRATAWASISSASGANTDAAAALRSRAAAAGRDGDPQRRRRRPGAGGACVRRRRGRQPPQRRAHRAPDAHLVATPHLAPHRTRPRPSPVRTAPASRCRRRRRPHPRRRDYRRPAARRPAPGPERRQRVDGRRQPAVAVLEPDP